MPTPENWLYHRLRNEPVREDERKRGNSVVSRLRRLTEVDESTQQLRDEDVNECSIKTAESEIMTAGERRLVSLAAALIGSRGALSTAESKLLECAQPLDSRLVAHTRRQIRSGEDVLGSMFCSLRSARERRRRGATYTPAPIVDAMMSWARDQPCGPARVVDPGAGSGRFLIAAARQFPNAALVAIDVDPLAALMLRANAAVHGFADRLIVYVADYRTLMLPKIAGPTLFIGNPPYVRHHDISNKWKAWLAATARSFGLGVSKLAGLHIHFFLKTRELGQTSDYGTFITAAEWMDVNYGSVLRRLLVDGLGGTAVHIIDPKAQPFADALTTAAITCFRIGMRPTEITLRSVGSVAELVPLSRGRAVATDEIAAAPKWSVFVREHTRSPAGFIELGELFRVHRGQVTGGNGVWIDNEAARGLPNRFKPFTITSARQLFAAGAELTSTKGLQRIIDLPVDLDVLKSDEREAVRRFLAWAKRHGAHESYIARHRRAWWAVGLRAPAPILCTYMARQAPAFVRNRVMARHINIAHGLYPRAPLTDAQLNDIVGYLRRHMGKTGGRTYAGGLVKFEPKELERALLPRIEEILNPKAPRESAPSCVCPCGSS
jgi:hypothetical protein